MDKEFIEEHKDDDVYELIEVYGNEIRLSERRERDSMDKTCSLNDRAVMLDKSRIHLKRARWCKDQIQKVIGGLINEASTPVVSRAIAKETLMEALVPDVQPADGPHWTAAHIDALDYYFWLIPKPDEGWTPMPEYVKE